MAIAQHHGLPTRLLDWTRDPFVAIYIAAIGAAKIVMQGTSDIHPNADRGRILFSSNEWQARFEGKFLEVWAINLRESRGAAISEDETNKPPHIHVVVAPRAGNENLHAQRGIFTIPSEPNGIQWNARKGTPIPLQEMVRSWDPLFGKSPFLIRFRLPLCFGPDLLELSVRLGKSASNLFPGFDGAVRSLAERGFTKSYFEDPDY